MSGMKFRRSCSECDDTFFTPDRKILVCPKCLKKKSEQQPKVVHIRQADARALQHGARRAPTARGRARPQRSALPAPQPAGPARQPKLPKVSELNDTLKQRIVDAYRELNKDGVALRIINAQISDKVWAKRKVVMQVVSEIRGIRPPADCATPAPDQQARIIEQFETYFRQCVRPEHGRHRAIAAMVGVPVNAVRRVRQEWLREKLPREGALNRTQLFQIEKSYWEELSNQSRPLEEFPELIAGRTGFPSLRVLMWIDQLHDENAKLKATPLPSAEDQQVIVSHYLDYLKCDAPPPESLHKSIAAATGISSEQVHKVLVAHRNEARQKYRESITERG